MIVKELKLVQFRNYDSLLMNPSKGLNFIVGENAQGKTNIIEALFLLSFCRSHRTRRDGELIQWEKDTAYICLELENQTGHRTVEIKFSRADKKSILLDGCPVSSQKLLEVFHAVLFAPEDLSLVKLGPDVRRRFLDMELCKIKPSYFYDLLHYNGALKQKNALLKSKQPLDRDLFIAYDRQLATFGAKIMRARAELILDICEIAAVMNEAISQGKDALRIEYEPDVSIMEADVKEKLFDAIQEANELSMRRGFMCAGPHRDDIRVLLNQKDIRAFGSQGQQRSAALCLKLSQIEIYRRITGEAPVLLLDDVLSELDANRQQLLMENTMDCQTFLTGTELIPFHRDTKVYFCNNAALSEQLLD